MNEERNSIRLMLLRNSLTQTWLINRLEENGVRTDKTELSSALGGRRKGEKVNLIISKSIEILTEYEQKMAVGGTECQT
ncbi:MAG: hypothetical protein WHF31_16110 [Candidatus Dehalobacter alkaniphilus]